MTQFEQIVRTVEAPVRENRDLGAGYRLMRLDAKEIATRARAGQFVTLGLPGRTDVFLPRPLAILDADPDAGEVRVLFKIVGRGTRILADLAADHNQSVRLIGPLGRGWRARDEGRSILVAGGTGYAALHLLARGLAESGREVRIVWGHSCSDACPATAPLEVAGVELGIATDDGTRGFRGTSVECLRDMLGESSPGNTPGAASAVYGAGPIPMMATLAELARERGLACQVSLEARMACGIGVCRGCVVNARAPHPVTGLRRRAVCSDGPVFDAEELDWENLR